MSVNFQRKKEDFICQNCGNSVKGDGYTNHCPECLFSKHVDINPGDREHGCQGLMEPVRIEMKGQEMIIVHKCRKCGQLKNNRKADTDNMAAVRRISSESIFT